MIILKSYILSFLEGKKAEMYCCGVSSNTIMFTPYFDFVKTDILVTRLSRIDTEAALTAMHVSKNMSEDTCHITFGPFSLTSNHIMEALCAHFFPDCTFVSFFVKGNGMSET
jgi:hypothetical protein